MTGSSQPSVASRIARYNGRAAWRRLVLRLEMLMQRQLESMSGVVSNKVVEIMRGDSWFTETDSDTAQLGLEELPPEEMRGRLLCVLP